jgi:mono/diheme cytochrome c family protein
MKRVAAWLAVVMACCAAAFFYISQPKPIYPSSLSEYTGDAKNGKMLFTAGGCLSCHKPGKDQEGADGSLPSGGFALATPVGTFYPPNLTPDPETGIGHWKRWHFINAMKRGLSPDGRHYLPAFPYTSYAAMTIEDLTDLFAYLKSLPPVRSEQRASDIPLLPVVRRGTGVWKALAFSDETFVPDDTQTAQWNRGAYLVKGPGHCSECHTPRNFAMMPDLSRYLAGGPHPEGGKDKVPSLRDLIGRKRYKDAKDLVSAFQFGEAFGYDKMSSGGMGAVQTNLSKLPVEDLEAIAAYLTSLK